MFRIPRQCKRPASAVVPELDPADQAAMEYVKAEAAWIVSGKEGPKPKQTTFVDQFNVANRERVSQRVKRAREEGRDVAIQNGMRLELQTSAKKKTVDSSIQLTPNSKHKLAKKRCAESSAHATDPESEQPGTHTPRESDSRTYRLLLGLFVCS